MTPTNKLRFVKRLKPLAYEPGVAVTVMILQQWWAFVEDGSPDVGEWRDVPVEEETTS